MKKQNKFDILKTFEIFNSQALTVLKNRLIEIVMLESDNIFAAKKNLFSVDIKKDDSAQITIINDRETYDLLSNTWQRHKKKVESVKKLVHK